MRAKVIRVVRVRWVKPRLPKSDRDLMAGSLLSDVFLISWGLGTATVGAAALVFVPLVRWIGQRRNRRDR